MLDHPYAAFLAEVKRPGRYTGAEFGAAPVPEEAVLRLALAFPDAYELGTSHIGLAVLYEAANALPGISAERVFMPWPDLEEQLRARKLPLVSLESARPLHRFDVLGFSLQYELNYTNLIAMLDLGGVPRRAADRGADAPLVLVGGPLAPHSEPLAPFVDICLVGDGEEALPEILSTIGDCRADGADRRRTIAQLHRLPHSFAPHLLERREDPRGGRTVVIPGDRPAARRAVVNDLGAHAPGRGPVPVVESVFDRYSLEVARGCTEGCRFCQAGMLYRPVRERTVEQVGAATRVAVSCLGFDEISLASLSTADHSQVGPMLTGLGARHTPERVSLSVPSLRAYGLPDELVEVVSRLRGSGVTLAPEAGSQRLRDVVNKNVTEDDLLVAAARFFDWGQRRVKLYFMLGLPGEQDEDLVAIAELAGRLRQLGTQRLGGRPPDVVVSVSTFVPRPFTPFEREPMLPRTEITRRQAVVEAACRKRKLKVRLHDPRLSVLEGVLSRGDVTLAPVLERAVDLGARFDGWGEMFREDVWEELGEELGLDRLLEAIPDEAELPWSHVDIGVEAAFLQRERDRAREGRTTQPCGRFTPRDAQREKPVVRCHACGLECPPEELPLRPRRGEPPSVDDLGPPAPRPRGKPRPREAPPERAEPTRVRITIAKWGRQAFVGHLDTVRAVTRSLRRAGLELAYTRGFHPKPRMETGPPLPLGVAGLSEPLDAALIEPPPAPELLERLSPALPPDMAALDARLLAPGERSLNRSLASARYVALVDCQPELLAAGLASLLDADEIVVERERKGRVRRVDIRPFLLDARALDAVPDGLHLPPCAGRRALALHLEVAASGGARVSELLERAVGDQSAGAWVVRTGFEFRQ